MSVKNKEMSQEIRNFVAKNMYNMGCKIQVIEDKKSKMKRGEGKSSFNSSVLRKEP